MKRLREEQAYVSGLEAERDALKAENERLKLALGESEQLRSAQVDAVSSENERLRAALQLVADSAANGDMVPTYEEKGIRRWVNASTIAVRALAPEHSPSGSKP